MTFVANFAEDGFCVIREVFLIKETRGGQGLITEFFQQMKHIL